jgi:YVTN family beta-propeller protein
MKIKVLPLIVIMFVLALSFEGCKDKEVVKGAFENGVLVANEGGFNASNGDVTYYNSSDTALNEQNIYKAVNGSFAGNVLQSIFIDGDQGYLVVNADNKIEIVDDNTFKLQNTISDPKIINPRYLQVINGKAYISCWGALNSSFEITSSSVVVVDLKSLSVVATIPTDPGVENLLYNGQYLFAADYNFGGSNTVKVIDPTSNTVVKTISLSAGPSGMVLDASNKLWVLTTDADAELIRINLITFAKEDSVSAGSYPNSDLAISPDKKTLVYSSGNSVYTVSVSSPVSPTAPLFTASDVKTLYALNVNPSNGDIYLGDALNYATAGHVYIYTASGAFKSKFTSGIAPGQFIFR